MNSKTLNSRLAGAVQWPNGEPASRRRLACMSASLAVLAICAPTAALAQDGGATRLEEVVVTAQKRVQRLQDVPVSVTALSAESLIANRITTVRDLDALVPNLTVRTFVGGASLPTYTIRGLISQGSAVGSDKGVAVYIDGVYLGSATGSMFELADIERIEALRGPQGTLFGRNSTGGAISFTTPDPSGEFRVRQRLTVGNYDQIRSSTTVDTPQLGAFSARASYTHSERRGDTRNLGAGKVWDFTPANGGRTTLLASPSRLGDSDVDAVAAKVKFEPSDRFKLVYSFDWTKETLTAVGQGVVYEQPLIKSIIAAQPNQALMTQISRTRPDAVNNAGVVPTPVENWGHALTAVFELSDHVTLKNIAATRRMKFSAPWQDFAGAGGLINTGAPIFATLLGPALAASTVGAPFMVQATTSTGEDEQWSDELQLNIDTNLATLTSGLLYYEQTSTRAPYGEDSGLGRARSGAFRVYPGYLVPFAGQAIGTRGRGTTVKSFSRAAYAQGEFHVTPQLDLVAGARYTKDTKKGLDNSILSGTVATVFPIYFKKGKWTYNLGVNYKINSDILTYAKYSTGYISGGSLAGLIYEPETAKSWEAGVKADWLDRRLRTNLAVFDVKYANLQLGVGGSSLTPPNPSITQALVTAGDAKARGFEFEGTFLPVRSLTLGVGIGYTDFEFTRLSTVVTASSSEFLVAQRPDWTANLSAQYTSEPLFDDVAMTARVDAKWKSRQNGVPNIPASLAAAEVPLYKAAQVINSHWVVNGRVALQGFKLGGADATVALWGRNIFDDKSPTFVTSLVTMITANYEPARTFGVDLNIEF